MTGAPGTRGGGESPERGMESPKRSADAHGVERHSRTVLLVDDEAGVRDVLALMLQSVGYDVLEAPSGARAVELVASLETAPDLIVCDLSLPDVSGAELVARLRADAPRVPVVYVSGWDAGEVGPLDSRSTYLQKPFPLRGLLDAVDQVTGERSDVAVA